jgi:uncharacterized protein YoxC
MERVYPASCLKAFLLFAPYAAFVSHGVYTVAMQKPPRAAKAALAVTRAIGSPASIIIHTILFIASFAAADAGYITFDRMLLVLTTIVSLEAIYLSIFIQMTINYTTESIEEVEKDIDEIQEDIDEMQEDVEEIAEDVDEIQEDVDELQEDVEDIEESDDKDEVRKSVQAQTLSQIQTDLRKLMEDIAKLQNK